MPIFKIKLIVHLFIEAFTITTIEKKVIILEVISSQLLVMLNVKPTTKLLTSYKKILTSILEDKTLCQIFYQLLVWRLLQVMEKKNRYQRQIIEE